MPIPGVGARPVRRDARTTRLGLEPHPLERSSPSREARRSDPGAPVVLTDEDVAAFLGLSTEVFCEFGPDGQLVWANSATATALGYGEEEFQEMPLGHLVHPDDMDDVRAMFRVGSPEPAMACRET